MLSGSRPPAAPWHSAPVATAPRSPLWVADTGIGIAAGEQSRVFDRFHKGGRGGGRNLSPGLGLSLVKSFIELHGGSVDLESEPGRGTRVTCRLPVRDEASLSPPSTALAQA